MSTPEYLRDHIFPASLSLLPAHMNTPAARAMLLAIALQESKCEWRVQMQGPAHSFWMFERGGVSGVLTHPQSGPYLPPILRAMCVLPTTVSIYDAITDNDLLATICARLLLWTLPDPLPDKTNAVEGWGQYLDAWRPGKPHQHTWAAHYQRAWDLVEAA